MYKYQSIVCHRIGTSATLCGTKTDISSTAHVKWANRSDFFHYDPQILPLSTEISNVALNKHRSQTDIYEMMNKYSYDCHRWKRNQVRRIVNGGGNQSSKEANLFEPFWTFPYCLFPSPSIRPLFSLPVLYSSSGAIFPPLLSLFLPLCVPSVSLCLVVSV